MTEAVDWFVEKERGEFFISKALCRSRSSFSGCNIKAGKCSLTASYDKTRSLDIVFGTARFATGSVVGDSA